MKVALIIPYQQTRTMQTDL